MNVHALIHLLKENYWPQTCVHISNALIIQHFSFCKNVDLPLKYVLFFQHDDISSTALNQIAIVSYGSRYHLMDINTHPSSKACQDQFPGLVDSVAAHVITASGNTLITDADRFKWRC